jgi:hypothetical protein
MCARLLPPLRSFLEAGGRYGPECDFERYTRTAAAFVQLANASS